MRNSKWILFSSIRCFIFAFLASLLAIGFDGCRKQPEKSTERQETFTFAYAAIPHASLVHIAFAKGFFADEKLKIHPQPHAFGKLALDAVLEGKADLATVAEVPVMFAILDGKKIRIMAVIETSDRDNAIIARKDMGIAKPRDIKGKTVGVAMGTSGEFFLDSFLTAQGIYRHEINIANMTPEQMQEGLLTKKIAAASLWNPTLYLCKKALGENAMVFFGEELYTEIFCVAADPVFVKKRPESLKKVLKALIRAEDFVRQHPGEAQDLVANVIKMDKPILRSIWGDYRFKVSLDQSLIVSLEDESRWAIQNRLVKSRSMPNYLDSIHTDALSSAGLGRVRIIR
jgi:ABC-type nitrate/sulfonate/bicarbonate transport system substrate-binding protein